MSADECFARANTDASASAAPNPMWTPAPWRSISTSERDGASTGATTTTGVGRDARDTDEPVDARERARPPPCARSSRLGVVRELGADVDAVEAVEGWERVAGGATTSRADVARDWRECFTDREDVRCERGTFRVYSYVDWSADDAESRPLVFMLHGCPYTALTWAPVVEELRRRAEGDNPQVAGTLDALAMDLRGHGESVGGRGDDARDDGASFDPDVMARDALETLGAFLRGRRRRVVVVGHSMGGAIAVRLASLLENMDEPPHAARLVGLVLVDIVEGSAMSALPAMSALVEARPTEFASLSDAMRWSASRGGGTTNFNSAAVSLPSQLREIVCDDGVTSKYVWRTDLRATAPYWSSWYRGLSARFLAVRAPKLLLLAANDRLDTELTIAQMQGKFQMTLCRAGHAIQEDDPSAVATALENFVARYVSNPRPRPPPFKD